MSPGLLDQTHTCCEINCVSPMWPPTLSESLWNNWGNDWMQKKSNQKGKGCKGKDVERVPQWVLLKDGMLPAHPDHESDAESLDPIEEEGEEQLSVPSSFTG